MSTASDQYFLSYVKKTTGGGQIDPPPAGIGLKDALCSLQYRYTQLHYSIECITEFRKIQPEKTSNCYPKLSPNLSYILKVCRMTKKGRRTINKQTQLFFRIVTKLQLSKVVM